MTERSPTEPAHAVFGALEAAIAADRPLSLSIVQCRAMLAWANDVTERKNEVVRENWRLAEQLKLR